MKTLPVICSECKSEFQKPISYIKQGESRGYPNHFCSNKCCISSNRKRINDKKMLRLEEYYKNPKKCPNCNSVLKYEDKKTHCSSKCAATYTQKNGGHYKWTDEAKLKMSKWAKKHAYRRTPKKDRIHKTCLFCNSNFEVLPYKNQQNCCSRKCKNAWIVKTGHLKNRGMGGNRPNSGTSKKGWYKGIFCGSSWELAWVIYQLEHGIQFKRNNEGFDYIFENKIKKYYPDFKLIDTDTYVEVKNYETKQAIEKTRQFPYKLKLLYKSDLKDVFDYVIHKYGKNYISLYEKKN